MRSLWKVTSRTGSTIASTLYLKWKGERIPVRSFGDATSKTYPWVGCSLKSRGLQQAESRFLCKAGSQLVQGRQARPRIICGPASHLPTSYLLPPATKLDLHGCSSRSSEEPCVSPSQSRRTGDAHVDQGPLPTWLVRLHLGPPGSTWVHLATSAVLHLTT